MTTVKVSHGTPPDRRPSLKKAMGIQSALIEYLHQGEVTR
jgi:hypothetical protein